MGHSTFTINGDTVTFGFRSDSGGYGQGYGYYAIVTGIGNSLTTVSGTYKEPERENYVFDGWNTKNDGSGTSISDESEITKLTNKNVMLPKKPPMTLPIFLGLFGSTVSNPFSWFRLDSNILSFLSLRTILLLRNCKMLVISFELAYNHDTIIIQNKQ